MKAREKQPLQLMLKFMPNASATINYEALCATFYYLQDKQQF